MFVFFSDCCSVNVVSDVHEGFPGYSPQDGAEERFFDLLSRRR